jgi:hypothetical protein
VKEKVSIEAVVESAMKTKTKTPKKSKRQRRVKVKSFAM